MSLGNAERWLKNHIYIDPNFQDMPFDNNTDNCIMGKFKRKYLTEEWYEKYTKQYEDKVQGLEETPMEYMETKGYLLQRGDPDCMDRT